MSDLDNPIVPGSVTIVPDQVTTTEDEPNAAKTVVLADQVLVLRCPDPAVHVHPNRTITQQTRLTVTLPPETETATIEAAAENDPGTVLARFTVTRGAPDPVVAVPQTPGIPERPADAPQYDIPNEDDNA